MSEEQRANRSKTSRSPSYPYINLEQAASLLTLYYEQEGQNKTHINVALEDMGYGLSGSGYRVLAALLQYGLLEDEGARSDRYVRITRLGLIIVEAPDHETRLEALQEAALRPDMHAAVWEHWKLDEQKLPSDNNMRYVLLAEFGFHKNAVDAFIGEFKETYRYARLDERIGATEAALSSRPSEKREAVEQEVFDVSEKQPTREFALRGMKEHTIQLIGQPMARLILPHPISERNLQHLIRWLELMGPALIVPEDEFNEPADEGANSEGVSY